jgi:hypothetical protein
VAVDTAAAVVATWLDQIVRDDAALDVVAAVPLVEAVPHPTEESHLVGARDLPNPILVMDVVAVAVWVDIARDPMLHLVVVAPSRPTEVLHPSGPFHIAEM